MTQETRRDLRFPMFVFAVAVAATAVTAIAWVQNRVVPDQGLVGPPNGSNPREILSEPG